MTKARMKTCSLVLLWLMFYIALGLPFFHSVLHSHLNHEHEHTARFLDLSWATPDVEDVQRCLICQFLATNQLCIDGLNSGLSTAEPVGFTTPAHPPSMSVAGSFIAQPRAPPSTT